MVIRLSLVVWIGGARQVFRTSKRRSNAYIGTCTNCKLQCNNPTHIHRESNFHGSVINISIYYTTCCEAEAHFTITWCCEACYSFHLERWVKVQFNGKSPFPCSLPSLFHFFLFWRQNLHMYKIASDRPNSPDSVLPPVKVWTSPRLSSYTIITGLYWLKMLNQPSATTVFPVLNVHDYTLMPKGSIHVCNSVISCLDKLYQTSDYTDVMADWKRDVINGREWDVDGLRW